MSEEIKVENKIEEKIENKVVDEILNGINELKTKQTEFENKLTEKDTKINELMNENNKLTAPKHNIVLGKEDLNGTFLNFLTKDVMKNTGVSVPLPAQYVPEIVPGVGTWGLKQYCNNVGKLDSNVLYISRMTTSPTPYWMSLTGGGASTSVSATMVTVNADELVIKVPIYDYQINMGIFNALTHVQREATRIMPKYEDIQIMTGSGSPFTGIYSDTDVPTVSLNVTGSITALAIGDLRNMIAKIDPGYRNPADLKWYVDMSEEQQLLGVVDTNNRTTDVTNGVTRLLGYEVVPVSSGVLNPSTTTTTASKHFVLANLKETIDYATGDFGVEGIRTNHGCTDYFFYTKEAFGVRNPYGACIAKLHA